MGGENRILLRDDPIDLATADRFRHRAYEDVLKDLVGDAEPPFTIGLFGVWGAGKSSITGQLRSFFAYKSGQTGAFVELDVWKFQSDSFRRQFLLHAEDQLVRQGALDRKTIEAELDTQVNVEGEGGFSFSRSRFAMTMSVLAVTLALSVLVFLLIRQTNTPSPELAFLTLILAPIFLNFTERLPAIIVQTKESKARLPAVTADRFETLFNDHFVKPLAQKKIDKVVVVMDNLDRLQSEQVVEVLGSVKTYVEVHGSPFMFIVPCDDEAVRRHIARQYVGSAADPEGEASAGQYAGEFLRKFFNVTIPLAPFYEDEMLAFAREQIGSMRLSENEEDDTIERLAQMVAFAFRDSPRRAKQFLNNLAARKLLADARIQQGILKLGDERFSLLILARLMTIEARWPDTFAKVRLNPSLLRTLEAVRPIGVREEQDPEEAAELTRLHDLNQFLLATEDIGGSESTIRAYMLLKQTEDEAMLPDYGVFRTAAVAGDFETAVRIVQANDKELQERYVRTMLRIIKENAQHGLAGQAKNSTNVLIQLTEAIPELDKMDIADAIGAPMLHYTCVMDGIAESPVHAVLTLLGSSWRQTTRRAQAIDVFIERLASLGADKSPGDLARAKEIVDAFAKEVETLTENQRTNTANVIGTHFATEPSVLYAVSATEEARMAFIGPSTVAEFAKSLTKEQLLG